jgi:hypothetical protein
LHDAFKHYGYPIPAKVPGPTLLIDRDEPLAAELLKRGLVTDINTGEPVKETGRDEVTAG